MIFDKLANVVIPKLVWDHNKVSLFFSAKIITLLLSKVKHYESYHPV